MRAICYRHYGPPDVLNVEEVPKPVPGENQVLIRIHAVSVNYGDITARNFKNITPRTFNMPFLFWFMARMYFGVNKPKVHILGSEFSGRVEAIGNKVTSFEPGDDVFGYTGQGMGAAAEYCCMAENGVLAAKPASLSHEQAAAIPYGAVMALYLVRKQNLQPQQKVLILGASGSLGSAALQIAKHLGAHVTGVCSTPSVEYVKSLGADRVIDYTQEDFTQGGETYDLIMDILGRSSFARTKSVLAPGGRHLYVSFKMKQLLQMLLTSVSGGKRVVCMLAPGSRDDLLAVSELAETGIIKAHISRAFTMQQAADAHRHVEKGHKTGGTVITVTTDTSDT